MKRPVAIALAGLLLAASGCHMFSSKKKTSPPKDSKAAAADTEKEFMQRWIDKRTADLVAQGKSETDAHAQAVADFKEKYPFTNVASQAK